MIKIFADSNFFIGLFNPEDKLHNLAIESAYKIKKEKVKIYISDLVFLEVVTVLSQRASRQVAVKVGQELQGSSYNMVRMDKDLWERSWEEFTKIKRKNMSFVDCSILAVMQAEGIKKLLTFGREDFFSLRKAYDFSFYTQNTLVWKLPVKQF